VLMCAYTSLAGTTQQRQQTHSTVHTQVLSLTQYDKAQPPDGVPSTTAGMSCRFQARCQAALPMLDNQIASTHTNTPTPGVIATAVEQGRQLPWYCWLQ
jgi:hypothetical protein